MKYFDLIEKAKKSGHYIDAYLKKIEQEKTPEFGVVFHKGGFYFLYPNMTISTRIAYINHIGLDLKDPKIYWWDGCLHKVSLGVLNSNLQKKHRCLNISTELKKIKGLEKRYA